MTNERLAEILLNSLPGDNIVWDSAPRVNVGEIIERFRGRGGVEPDAIDWDLTAEVLGLSREFVRMVDGVRCPSPVTMRDLRVIAAVLDMPITCLYAYDLEPLVWVLLDEIIDIRLEETNDK